MERSRVTTDTRPISTHQAADRLCRRHYQPAFPFLALPADPRLGLLRPLVLEPAKGKEKRKKKGRRSRSACWLGVKISSTIPAFRQINDDDGGDDRDDADDQSLIVAS